MNYVQIKQYAGSIVTTMLAVSNIYFWNISGYFDESSGQKVLIHTWSLGLEEQFYILFPITLMVFYSKYKHRSLYLWFSIIFLSIVASEYFSSRSPSGNFYLLPTRLWEFLVGAACAYSHWRPQPVTATLMSIGSIIVFLAYGVFLPPSASFPSLALVPLVLATVMLILAGTAANAGARFLSFRPLVAIGLSSYSIYLWHQPLFALARIRTVEPLDTIPIVGLCFVAVVLGMLTWWFIERPLRASPRGYLQANRTRALGVGLVGLVLTIVGLAAYVTNGFAAQSRIPPLAMADLQVRALQDRCYDFRRRDIDVPEDWYCTLNAQVSGRNVAIIGDSHVLSYLSPLTDALNDQDIGVTASSISGCPPLRNTNVIRHDDIMLDCNARNSMAFSPAALKGASLAILIARWSYYGTGDITGQIQPIKAVGHDDKSNGRDGKALFGDQLQNTVDYLHRSGLPTIILLQPPVQKIEPTKAYAAAFLFGSSPVRTIEKLSLLEREHVSNTALLDKLIRSSSKGGVVIDVTPELCAGICRIGTLQRSYFYDRNHLSNFGATLVVPKIVQEVNRMLCANQTGVTPSAPPAGRCPSLR